MATTAGALAGSPLIYRQNRLDFHKHHSESGMEATSVVLPPPRRPPGGVAESYARLADSCANCNCSSSTHSETEDGGCKNWGPGTKCAVQCGVYGGELTCLVESTDEGEYLGPRGERGGICVRGRQKRGSKACASWSHAT